MANTLAYYDTATITAVKSFTVQAPGVLSLYTFIIGILCSKKKLNNASFPRLWHNPKFMAAINTVAKFADVEAIFTGKLSYSRKLRA